MKYNEIDNPNIRQAKHEYIDSRWRGLHGVVSSTLTRVLNYLFVLNSGGLLAVLTYIAAKPKTDKMYFSIWCFVSGIIFITVHAALDYYSCERQFSGYRKDVDAFFKSEIDWEVMVDRDNRRPRWDWLLHALGWASGLAFAAGLCVGICRLE